MENVINYWRSSIWPRDEASQRPGQSLCNFLNITYARIFYHQGSYGNDVLEAFINDLIDNVELSHSKLDFQVLEAQAVFRACWEGSGHKVSMADIDNSIIPVNRAFVTKTLYFRLVRNA